ncbi:ferric enterobactin transport ATP-binding protein [Citrobacter koseri]|uniref:Ferric enterobactin transport ATP-binding protein n=1 Tax=Citrobacter koseri TaxID=545 RepID=A0A078L802_CITKO|nr:ferric enterobactin transport ATP-binding protein [Citrobacter koseri]
MQFVASSDNPASALSVNIASLQRPGGGELLCAIRFEVEEGKCLAVIGPNGSGKTSLLRAISQELPLQKGNIQLLGRSVSALSRQQRAKQIAVLAQNDTPDLRLALEDYVALARVLAQMPSLVLLDEPTNHLDPSGRVELLSLVKNKGITVVAVLHDLSLIESFADRVLLLSQGRMVLCDTPERVLVSENLYPVFGLTCFTVPHPDTGKALRIFEVPGYA